MQLPGGDLDETAGRRRQWSIKQPIAPPAPHCAIRAHPTGVPAPRTEVGKRAIGGRCLSRASVTPAFHAATRANPTGMELASADFGKAAARWGCLSKIVMPPTSHGTIGAQSAGVLKASTELHEVVTER